jgi:hypothetical protein
LPMGWKFAPAIAQRTSRFLLSLLKSRLSHLSLGRDSCRIRWKTGSVFPFPSVSSLVEREWLPPFVFCSVWPPPHDVDVYYFFRHLPEDKSPFPNPQDFLTGKMGKEVH